MTTVGPSTKSPAVAGQRPRIARSGERRKAEERLLTDSMGQLVREWLARATTPAYVAWSS